MQLAWQQMVWCASTLAVACTHDGTAESEAGSEQQEEASVSRGEPTEQPDRVGDAASEPGSSAGEPDANTAADTSDGSALMDIEAGACLPGTSQCVDPLAQRLCTLAGAWGERTGCVHQTCSAGLCTGFCAPNELGCKDAHSQLSCQANGAWLETVCADQACVAGACVGVCSPGTRRCAGYDLQTCNEGGGWASEACAFGCNAMLLRCRPDPLCKDCPR
jgi:hypothetical protein